MDNLLTITDFIGRYSLSISEFAIDTFNSYITDYQYDLLIDMLGAELYNDFNANPTDAKWTDFQNGITYTDCNGDVQNWRGLKDLLIPFVYSKFTLENYKKQVQSGVVKPKFENADILNERERKEVAYKAWNDFISKYYEAYMFLYTYESTYTDFSCFFKRKSRKSLVIQTNLR